MLRNILKVKEWKSRDAMHGVITPAHRFTRLCLCQRYSQRKCAQAAETVEWGNGNEGDIKTAPQPPKGGEEKEPLTPPANSGINCGEQERGAVS